MCSRHWPSDPPNIHQYTVTGLPPLCLQRSHNRSRQRYLHRHRCSPTQRNFHHQQQPKHQNCMPCHRCIPSSIPLRAPWFHRHIRNRYLPRLPPHSLHCNLGIDKNHHQRLLCHHIRCMQQNQCTQTPWFHLHIRPLQTTDPWRLPLQNHRPIHRYKHWSC